MNILNNSLNIVPLNIFIDPQYPVERAIITHAHADHAKPGHKMVLGTKETVDIMKIRYGKNCAKHFQVLKYGEELKIDGIKISLHPAGHILGSSQVLINKNDYKYLITGDFKTVKDGTTTNFEVIGCNTLIIEATFGLPIFQHPCPNSEIKKLIKSIKINKNNCHIVGSYALGKAQRVIKLLRDNSFDETIYIHGALEKICNYYQEQGISLGNLEKIPLKKSQNFNGKVILAPPSATKDRWSRKFSNKILSQASGWMSVKQRVKQSLVELPLIISDHSDWNELTETIINTNAENVWITHGREDGLMYWCKKKGINSKPLALSGREDEK